MVTVLLQLAFNNLLSLILLLTALSEEESKLEESNLELGVLHMIATLPNFCEFKYDSPTQSSKHFRACNLEVDIEIPFYNVERSSILSE